MSLLCKILIVICCEIALTIIYTIITPREKKLNFIDYKSVAKGIVERAFLAYSLLQGFAQVLTLFGALKLGTRLKSADNEATEEGRKREIRYNDYYLIGNLISVALGIFYYSLFKI